MQKKLIVMIILTIIACNLVIFISDTGAQIVTENKEKSPSRLGELWKKFVERTYIYTIIMTLVATVIGIILATVKRDKLLKSLAKQLITIEMISGARYRGRLRVESEGIEVIAEKANEGSNEKVSYILRKDEMATVHALVRYLDLLTEKEKHQRNDELAKAYHPSVIMRLRRKIRNIVNQIRRVASDLFNALFARRVKGKLGSAEYETEYQAKGKEAIEAMTSADYDSLIDKLIGTRVIIQTPKGEYVGVFKDYTSLFIELLDVNYKSSWVVGVDRDAGYANHDRGLILYRNGSNIVMESKSPFRIILKSILWKEGPQDVGLGDANTTLAIIEPFGRIEYNINAPQFDKVIAPFEKLQLPINYTYGNYKWIMFTFESTRTADLVMSKGYGILRHRTEKYEPKLIDINSLTDSLLTTKEESFLLKGTPAGTTMTIHNGYITNMPKERMDAREVDDQISQRWAVETHFEALDKKIRPVVKFRVLGPFLLRRTKKILMLFTLMGIILSDVKRKNDPLLPYIYRAILVPNVRKRRRFNKRRMRVRKPSRILELIRKPFSILRQPQKV
jgi:hypothetical protein